MENLTATQMKEALSALDDLLEEPLTLIVGGGGALILAHGLSLATSDIDAIPTNRELAEIDPLIKQVAQNLEITPDWLNPYFGTFTHVLPSGYEDRLVEVFGGKKLRALALSKEEMLIMKCFAGRKKDVAHARAILRSGKVDLSLVENHLESLIGRKIPGASDAMDFFDEIKEFSP